MVVGKRVWSKNGGRCCCCAAAGGMIVRCVVGVAGAAGCAFAGGRVDALCAAIASLLSAMLVVLRYMWLPGFGLLPLPIGLSERGCRLGGAAGAMLRCWRCVVAVFVFVVVVSW